MMDHLAQLVQGIVGRRNHQMTKPQHGTAIMWPCNHVLIKASMCRGNYVSKPVRVTATT